MEITSKGILRVKVETKQKAEALRGPAGRRRRSDPQCRGILQALDAQTGQDPGEPSAQALAALIADEQFEGAYWRVRYLNHNLGAGPVEVKAFVNASLDAWRAHPMSGMFQALAADRAVPAGYWALLNGLQPRDAGPWFMREYAARSIRLC